MLLLLLLLLLLLQFLNSCDITPTAETAGQIVNAIVGTINTEHNIGLLVVAVVVVVFFGLAFQVVTDARLASDDHFSRGGHFAVVVVVVV